MENFCKGVILGMVAGACIGAVVVVKNKKLSNKLKEGLVTAEGKLKEIKESIEDKMNESSCEQNNCNCDLNSSGFNQQESEKNMDFSKNNFSKKNKND